MATTPIIRTSQAAVVVTGVGREDLATGAAVTLTDAEGGNTGGSYQWQLEDKPPGSSATITNPTTATASITPDVTGSYRIRCTVNGSFFSAVIIAVPLPNSGMRMPSFLETDVFPTAYTGGSNTKGWHTAMVAGFRAFDAAIAPFPGYGLVGDITALGSASAGVSALVARADHAHTHGNQAGGSLHAAAVAGVSAGFMTAAMATALAAATTDIATMSSTVVGHTSSIATLTSGLSTANANIATNASNISSLTTTVGGHTTTLASHTSSIGTLTSGLAAAVADIATNTSAISTLGGSVTALGAPKYIVQQANVAVPNAQALGALGSGYLKVTTTTGVVSSTAVVNYADVGGGTQDHIPFFDGTTLAIDERFKWDVENGELHVLGVVSVQTAGAGPGHVHTEALTVTGVLKITETGGDDRLTLGPVSDGQFFRRVGTDIVGSAVTMGDITGTATRVPFFGGDGVLSSVPEFYYDGALYVGDVITTGNVDAGYAARGGQVITESFLRFDVGDGVLIYTAESAPADGEDAGVPTAKGSLCLVRDTGILHYNSGIAGATVWTPVGGGANSLGSYIVQTTADMPTNAQVLASLASGIVKNTTTTGVLSIATAADIPSLLTTKGDLLGFSTVPLRVGVETDGWVVTADAASAAGWKWAAPSGGGSGADALGRYVVQIATNAPANAQVLASLGTGYVRNTTTTGVLSSVTTVPYTDVSGGTNKQIPYFDSGGLLTKSADFTWDNTAKKIFGEGTDPYLQLSTENGTELHYGPQYFRASSTVSIYTGNTKRLEVDADGNVIIGPMTDMGNGERVLALSNRVETPTSNTTGGLVMFSNGGNLKSIGASGTGSAGNHYRMQVFENVELVTGFPGTTLEHGCGITPTGVHIQQADSDVEFAFAMTNVTSKDATEIQIESSQNTFATVTVFW